MSTKEQLTFSFTVAVRSVNRVVVKRVDLDEELSAGDVPAGGIAALSLSSLTTFDLLTEMECLRLF